MIQFEQNKQRASFAQRALQRFAQIAGERNEDGALHDHDRQNLIDLLANLAHYCDEHAVNMKECLLIAKGHYKEETNDQGKQL